MSPRSLAATLPKVTKATLARHGRAYAAIVAEWHQMVGKAIADHSAPEKLSAGVLTVRVSGGAAMELQHREPQILERINGYVGGGRTVTRLRLIQAPVGRSARRRPLPPPPPDDPTLDPGLEDQLSGVSDPDLKASLRRFGRYLRQHQKSEK